MSTVISKEDKDKSSSDANVLLNKDLVVIQGGDVNVQNFVLTNIKNINSPVLPYFIISLAS